MMFKMQLLCRKITLISFGVITSIGSAFSSQDTLWMEHERRCFGDLVCMQEVIDESVPIPFYRKPWDQDQLYQHLKNIGRFQQLGLTEEEGRKLVSYVFEKLITGKNNTNRLRPDLDRANQLSQLLEEKRTELSDHDQDDDDQDTDEEFLEYQAKAEFQELDGVLMRWPFDWASLRDEWAAMVDGMSRADVTVWMWVDRNNQIQQVTKYLQRLEVSTDHISWFVEPTNSIWMRDYGPHFIYDDQSEEWGVVDFHYYDSRPDDDDTPVFLSEHYEVPLVDRQTEDVVYTEGGNIAHDSLGTVFYSERTYVRNPEEEEEVIDERILSAFQAHTNIVLKDPQLDATGHIDMFMKIANENTILVGQYDLDETDYQVLEDNVQILENTTNGAGDTWNIIRIRQPDAYYDSFVYPVVRTYTNSLLVNNVILLPVYGIDDDIQAIQTYELAFPDREIVPINAESIIRASGAWHCVTMEFPSPNQ